MSKALGLALVLLATPACILSRSQVNEPLVAAKLAALTPGKSTAADVAAHLGAPTDVVQLGTRMAWRYDFAATKSTALFLLIVNLQNSDSRADRAWLFFDAAGVLQYAGTTFQAGDVEYAMPWEDVHDRQ